MDRTLSPKEIRRARLRKLIGPGVGIACAAGLAVWLFSAGTPSAELSGLRLGAADRGNVASSIITGGKVVAASQIQVNSPVASSILEVNCRVGDQVEAGTPLLTLDLEQTRAELSRKTDQLRMKELALEQQLARDRTELARIAMEIEVAQMRTRTLEVELANERYLDSIGTGTGDRVRQAEFELATQSLTLSQLRQQLENETAARNAATASGRLEIEIMRTEAEQARRTLADAYIRAPRRSTVTEINDVVGAQVTPGQKLAVVSDLGHYKVEASAGEMYAGVLTPGVPVSVKIEGHTLEGTVSGVSPTSTDSRLAFTVALADDSAAVLRHGQRPQVYVHRELLSDVVRIPFPAYYTTPGQYDVYIRQGNELHLRTVRLGAASYDYVEVVDGIEPGEEVVTTDLARFNKAKTIKIKQ